MTSKAAIFVVFAIVVQISSANLLLTTSEIAGEISFDFKIVDGLNTLINLQHEKLIERIKVILRLAYLLKAGRHDPGAEECSDISETCKERIFGGMIDPIVVALEAIGTTNPGLSSSADNAVITAPAGVSSLAEGICSAIEIALDDGGSDAIAEIQELAEKNLSEVEISNEEYFNLLLAAETIPTKISAAIETANRRATCHRKTAVRDMFTAIITFVADVDLGDNSPLEEISEQLEISMRDILAEMNADISIKLNTIKSIALAFRVIQTANPVDCGAVAPINVTGFFNDEEADGSNSPSNPIEIPDIFIKTPDQILAEFCRLIATKKAHLSGSLEAIEIIYGVIYKEFTETGMHGASTNHSLAIDEAKEGTVIAWKAVADAVYRAVQVLLRGDSEKLEEYTSGINSISMLNADYIFDLIKFTENKKSTGLVHKVATIAEELISSAGGLVSRITEFLLNAGQINSALQPALARAGELAVHDIGIGVSNIITAIQILLASVLPQLQFGIQVSSSLLATTKENAISAYVGVNARRFYMMETIYIVNSLRNDSEYLATHAHLQSSHEIRESNAVQGFDIIFVTAMNLAKELSHHKHKDTEDYESELQAARERTFLLSNAAVQSTVDEFVMLNSRAHLTTQIDRESISIALRMKLTTIYAALGLMFGTDSLEITTQLEVLKNATISASLEGIAIIYTAFRDSGRHSPDTLAAIDRAKRTSTYGILEADSAVFAAVEIAMREIFDDIPESQTRFSSVEDARKAASFALRLHITGVTHLLEYLALVDTKMLSGLSDDSCPAETT